MSSSASKQIMNVQEAAAFLGISDRTLEEQARQGTVPAVKAGREWRFTRTSLLLWPLEEWKARRAN
jgi:excisionase family DNA binding protein